MAERTISYHSVSPAFAVICINNSTRGLFLPLFGDTASGFLMPGLGNSFYVRRSSTNTEAKALLEFSFDAPCVL